MTDYYDDEYDRLLAGVLGASPLMVTSSELTPSEQQHSPVILSFPTAQLTTDVEPPYCTPEDALDLVSSSLMELSHLTASTLPQSSCELSQTLLALGMLSQATLPSSGGTS